MRYLVVKESGNKDESYNNWNNLFRNWHVRCRIYILSISVYNLNYSNMQSNFTVQSSNINLWYAFYLFYSSLITFIILYFALASLSSLIYIPRYPAILLSSSSSIGCINSIKYLKCYDSKCFELTSISLK